MRRIALSLELVRKGGFKIKSGWGCSRSGYIALGLEFVREGGFKIKFGWGCCGSGLDQLEQ